MKTKLLIYSFLFALLAMISCGGSDDSAEPSGDPGLPTLLTATATNVSGSGTSATLRGQINSTGGYEIIKYGFCWGTSPNPVRGVGNFQENSGGDVGQYTMDVSGFTAGDSYFIRAYAQNEKGIGYGPQVAFVPVAQITTEIATQIHSTKVLLRAHTIGTESNQVGFVYGISPNPMVSGDNIATIANGTTGFEMELTGLLPDTFYFVRAFKAVGNMYL
ncbi:MAG: hypothetical protein EOO50_02615 [Flavobacterium sp.]|uniref:hypothetical protein n=1 Tax=Flavobacterium sp. TaxID=239 RepID=UPI0012054855|nr:hypothetical protein [Flavobacterium sp.]RZJ68331.1 MAG: hypothetical protein EOO50_02615 [Flavobacterium sp.]